MYLSELLKDVKVLNENSYKDKEILDVSCSTARDLKNSLFVCIKGSHTDGHELAPLALEKGAAAVVCERECGVENCILTENSREAYALICKNLFERKCDSMQLIAATGTNGKTSVATTIKRLLCSCGAECGLISTIAAEYGQIKEELENTTPDPYVLHRLFADMAKNGVKTVSMEASSHALDQKRLYGVHFDIAIFTNLSQDHLDYHKNMLEYYKAKKKLFEAADYAVINIDDHYGKMLKQELTIPTATFSVTDQSADYFAKDIVCAADGVSFQLCTRDEEIKITYPIPGIYSVRNAMAAIISCSRLGLSLATLAAHIADIGVIRGRNESIKTDRGFNVIMDYAHTPDGLESLLKATRQYAKGRITLLFGCGGDRDREKRGIMGAVAAKYADFIVVTSDNSRGEPPGRIISEILKGIPENKPHIAIIDRQEAIKYTLLTAKRGDTVILAGKGHEEYRIIGDKRLYFNERALVNDILKKLK